MKTSEEGKLPSPRYEISEAALRRNLEILKEIKIRGNCKIVLALKGFSLFHTFPLIRQYLDGCCASGLWEAQLAQDEMGGDILTYSPAYKDDDLAKLLEFSTHLDFNSVSQWRRFQEQALQHPRYLSGELKLGLRINPEHSTGSTPLYDPCAPGSRLGVTVEQLEGVDLEGLSTLHFHTLCEQNSDDLLTTINAVDEKFGHLLRQDQFTELNLGGGHWITKPDYDRETLVELLQHVRSKYKLEEVWLEPGEAVAIHTGNLVASVLDLTKNGEVTNAILDVSATGHMPDVLEMPYRPDVTGAGRPEEFQHTYRLGCPTCLAGDVIGDYSFEKPLEIGQELIFEDMAHYTMVKTTTFNGVQHPAIVILRENGGRRIVRQFTYDDFKQRLG